MRNFRNYDIWKDGIDIADKIYTLTDSFPKFETYGLSDQLRRAAVSIPSNVASEVLELLKQSLLISLNTLLALALR